jgi:predicted TIM-barrel fold metal-dependent hydrolase
VIHTGWNSKNPRAAKYNDPKYIVNIARKFPKLKIVISHYFWPELDYCYKLTKNFKNIYYDTSALADNEVVEATGIEKIKEILVKTIKKKPDSVLFGTDYSMCSMEKHIALINSLKISRKEKEKVFYKNAAKLFKLRLK